MAQVPRTSKPSRPPAQPSPPSVEGPPRRAWIHAFSKGSIAVVTALGTLLAGVAALVALWLPTDVTADPTEGSTDDPGEIETPSPAPTEVHDLTSMTQFVIDAAQPELPGGGSYNDYVALESGDFDVYLSVTTPRSWRDVKGDDWLDARGAVQGRFLAAGPDIDRLYDSWDTPGLFFGAGRGLDPQEVLDGRETNRRDSCKSGGTDQVLADGELDGVFRVWTRCGENGSVAIDIGVHDRQSAITASIKFRAVDQRDLAAFRTMIETFRFVSLKDIGSGDPGFMLP